MSENSIKILSKGLKAKRLLIRLLITFFWVISFYFIGISHIGYSEVLRPDIKNGMFRLMPQGWGFFTKDPTSEIMLSLYRYKNNEFELLTKNNASYKNLFGLSKEGRYAELETRIILQNIPDSIWKNGKGNILEKKIYDFTEVRVKDKLFLLKNKERYVITKSKQIPFAWANKNQEKYKPFLYTSILISN